MSILLGGTYKVRALCDTGSTTTVMSSSLLDECWSLKELVAPTNLGYKGVGPLGNYHGILKGMEMQIGEGLMTKEHIAVIENQEPFMLLGNDVVGGKKARFRRVAMNDDYSFMTLVDLESGHVENVHFLRNNEISRLPVSMLSILEEEPEGSVVELFRS